jgi:hypothetical protein
MQRWASAWGLLARRFAASLRLGGRLAVGPAVTLGRGASGSAFSPPFAPVGGKAPFAPRPIAPSGRPAAGHHPHEGLAHRSSGGRNDAPCKRLLAVEAVCKPCIGTGGRPRNSPGCGLGEGRGQGREA